MGVKTSPPPIPVLRGFGAYFRVLLWLSEINKPGKGRVTRAPTFCVTLSQPTNPVVQPLKAQTLFFWDSSRCGQFRNPAKNMNFLHLLKSTGRNNIFPMVRAQPDEFESGDSFQGAAGPCSRSRETRRSKPWDTLWLVSLDSSGLSKAKTLPCV